MGEGGRGPFGPGVPAAGGEGGRGTRRGEEEPSRRPGRGGQPVLAPPAPLTGAPGASPQRRRGGLAWRGGGLRARPLPLSHPAAGPGTTGPSPGRALGARCLRPDGGAGARGGHPAAELVGGWWSWRVVFSG